jgi:hypothetical protein
LDAALAALDSVVDSLVAVDAVVAVDADLATATLTGDKKI